MRPEILTAEEFKECETFEDLVLKYTGRDMDYHRRYETTGLELARLAWDVALSKQRQWPATTPNEGGGGMNAQLVLSLFPGIGLLDQAFEEAGFCVVRGPDLLWGGDIRRFHAPAGRFDGVIGGPPCQEFSRLMHVVRARGKTPAPNWIPEFERVVGEARPAWFLMENVEGAPVPTAEGYCVHAQLVRDVWVGGVTSRLRRFSFGSRDGRVLEIDVPLLHATPPEGAAVGSGVRRAVPGKKANRLSCYGYRTQAEFAAQCRKQGLPADFDLPFFTLAGKFKAVGNGMPLAMGRAVAEAVRRAVA